MKKPANAQDTDTQLVLGQLYEQVAKKLERKFCAAWRLKSDRLARGYIRMTVLMPIAQTAVVTVIRQLLEKHPESRRVVLTEDLSQENINWNYVPVQKSGVNPAEAKTIVCIVTNVLLTSGVFNKPRMLVMDKHEFSIQLSK